MHLADRVTVFRDGRHVLTEADGRARRGRASSPRWSAAACSARPSRRAGRRRRGRAVRVATCRSIQAAPQRLAAGAATASASTFAPARSSASAGCSAPGARKSWRRSSARPTGAAGGEIRLDGEAGRHPLAARRAPARPRAGHRGPQDARACICSASITDNVALPLGRPAGALRHPLLRRRGGARARCGRGARRPLRQHRAAGRHAVGRQPAEGRDRQMAGDAAARAAARRADARHRRRRQARDLRPRLPARPRGAGDRRRQLGAAGAAASCRPHPGHVGGPADRHPDRAEASEERIMQLAAPRARPAGKAAA